MTDPLVYLANRDATDEKESIHTHYNDDIKLVLDGHSLPGNSRDERGEAEKIVARAPLRLANGELFIDLTLIGNFANDAAAANGGVPVGGIYRDGSTLKIRVT
jgi:hypothetical protein